MHRFFLHNGEISEASARTLSAGQIGLLSGWGVFSTLRVVEGVLFAWEKHWARMARDAALLRVPFPREPGTVHERLLALVEANAAYDAVMRAAVVRNKGGMWQGPGIEREFDLIAFTNDLADWGAGARLGVAPKARYSASMFAGTKILSWAFNLAWLEDAQSRGFDEVVLLNERGEVSECTSANIFIVEGDRVWTPPLSSGCLPGVTRSILLHEVRTPGLDIGERALRLRDLEQADEVFITSTTRDLLPVLSIEGVELRRGSEAGRVLERAFAAYVKVYVASHKGAEARSGAV